MFSVSKTLAQSNTAWHMKGNDKNDVEKWIYTTLETIGVVGLLLLVGTKIILLMR